MHPRLRGFRRVDNNCWALQGYWHDHSQVTDHDGCGVLTQRFNPKRRENPPKPLGRGQLKLCKLRALEAIIHALM
jgi:hypothetical protein